MTKMKVRLDLQDVNNNKILYLNRHNGKVKCVCYWWRNSKVSMKKQSIYIMQSYYSDENIDF